MVFGDNSRFQINCTIAQRSESCLIGKISFWAQHECLGDNTDGIDLGLVLSHFYSPLLTSAPRYHPVVDKLSAEEFANVYMSYKYSDEESPAIVAGIFEPEFNKSIISARSLEGFDDFFIALVENKIEPVSKPVCRPFKRVAAGWSFSTTV